MGWIGIGLDGCPGGGKYRAPYVLINDNMQKEIVVASTECDLVVHIKPHFKVADGSMLAYICCLQEVQH